MNQGLDGHDSEQPKTRPSAGRKAAPESHGASERSHGPKPLSDILADLFAARGLARIQATSELEAAWTNAVGELANRYTQVDGLRRGILSIIVAHPTLLEELASFQKPDLLASLRRSLAGTAIHDIRFRIGPVRNTNPPGSPPPAPPKPPKPGRR